jgi:hypothetical protein
VEIRASWRGWGCLTRHFLSPVSSPHLPVYQQPQQQQPTQSYGGYKEPAAPVSIQRSAPGGGGVSNPAEVGDWRPEEARGWWASWTQLIDSPDLRPHPLSSVWVTELSAFTLTGSVVEWPGSGLGPCVAALGTLGKSLPIPWPVSLFWLPGCR